MFGFAAGLSYEELSGFIFNLHKERKLNKQIPLYRFFREIYPNIWEEYIDEFFKTAGFISPYESVINFYRRFKVLENFKSQQAFFMKLLELIKMKEEDYTGLGEFLVYLKEAPGEDLYVTVIHSDSIKVLTTHKSKGLEFAVVIIPFLRIDINPETGEKGASSYVIDDGKFLRLNRITKNHRLYSENLRQIYAQGYKKACIDELNKIYVALTRAQYELYIFVPKKSGTKNNKACFIIPSGIKEFGSKKSYEIKRVNAQQALMNIKPSMYTNWLELLEDDLSDRGLIKNKQKIAQGNVFHFVLSCVDNLCKQNIKDVTEEAIEKSKVLYPKTVNFSFIKEKMALLVKQEDLKKFFYVPAGKIYREKEVVNSFGDLNRIDRLIVKEKEAWAVDYKSSRENQEEYERQVKEYMEIIKGIYPKLEVKGYIIYIDEMIGEEI